MSEVVHDRKAAIRNTVIYAIALLLAVVALVTRKGALGYIVVGFAVLWAIGGLTANVRAIRHGFRNLD
jgi:branched-subunit amino acid transport protein